MLTTTSEQVEDLELIVGTYEDYIVGYQVESIRNNAIARSTPSIKKLKTSSKRLSLVSKDTVDLEQSFAVRCHSGSVKCLAASDDGKIVFSAGNDEILNLFNLKRRKLLQNSEGAINCATFVKNSHLICGCEDGNIQIYECKGSSMVLAKVLRGHTASVLALDAHPSGKVLLSVSKDNTLRTWNLIKGRIAYVTNMKHEAHLVKWSSTGNEFLIAANNEISLFNSLGNLKKSIKLDKRINSVEFITNSIFAVAVDSGKLEFFDTDECKLVIKFDAHEARLKSIKCLDVPFKNRPNKCDVNDGTTDTDYPATTNVRFATVSSDGLIKIWSMSRQKGVLREPTELAKMEVGARVTCMIVSTRRPTK